MMYRLHAQRERDGHIGRRMNRWVDKILRTSYHTYCPGEAWRPSVNLYEDASHYCLLVDLAGMRAEDIDLRIEDDKLIVSGQRDTPRSREMQGDPKLHLMEIDHGWFRRCLELPENVDVEAIEATYRGGFLWVRMPKKT